MSSLTTTVFELVARNSSKPDYAAIRNYRDHCTLSTCALSDSYWGYRPSLPANSFFLAIFAISTGLYLVQALLSKRFLGFTIAMVSGCLLEVIGYVGRILSYFNPFKEPGFLMQIVCLTIAPAFMAAGIYLCLSRIVTTFGAQNSRIAPLSYPRIFIPCDLISLLLQAAGGGLASAASHTNRDPTPGNNIMIAGLSMQVATLFVFMLLASDFAVRTLNRVRRLGRERALDPTHARLRASWAFQGFLVALAFATLCIFTRSVYRVAELSEGWNGHLIKTQKYFIGLEGAIVGLAVLALNVFHPGLCFREGYKGVVRQKKVGGRTWYGKKRVGQSAEQQQEEGVMGTPVSEEEVKGSL
ncbi:RTA1-domain-containing protein [Mytilinidion resinicola]|uniref:RTA1-domain-containing protein n=1 Tax=Mytilinidion resinicola TaxID=574789 RepID=A0A6A6YGS0_9PEZI|nr:RTA1-domain-containing protein [Mytilinidion resinicola]KAF2807225.1 RTA1-domain-containing protein [Mytilinidion resinicola]